MTSNRTILITGVTGQQGGAVAQALHGTGVSLRGLTRKPDSERATALARHGVDIVKGDLDDEAPRAWARGQATRLQMFGVDDIRWFGARAFTHAAAWNRSEIDLAGDLGTMPE